MSASPEQLHRDFEAAFNRHDLEALVLLYEPDAVLIHGGGVSQGVDAIREAYRRILTLRPTIRVETLNVHRAGDLAMMRSRWTWSGAGVDGEPIVSAGESVETVRRQPDGRWLFSIDDPRSGR